MASPFTPLLELVNGEAYCPHPGDAALPLGRRFSGKTLVVIGGGGTGLGWTQRVFFDRQGQPDLRARRSTSFKRGTAEWGDHLLSESRGTSGWALILIEQQWQAAVASTSGTSLGGSGVEQMLRVRDAITQFGDDRISEDAIRAAIDHPTMDGAIVVGARAILVEPLIKEAAANGFQVAGVRVGVAALLERHLGRLQKEKTSPSRTLVAYDGQSALIVGIRDGAFDTTDGGLSYLVNRSPSDVRTQVAKRISSPSSLRDWNGRVEIIGSTFTLEQGPMAEAVDVRQEVDDVTAAAIDERVRHDLRPDLQEVRAALPRWVRPAFLGALTLIAASLVGLAVQAAEGFRLRDRISATRAERQNHAAAMGAARARVEQLRAETQRAHQIGEWVDRNYHAQALVHGVLSALPVEVSLDALAVQAGEGLPQAKLRFTLLGGEDAQRLALRRVEERLYQLGYEIGRREDPTSSSARRGGVVYAWELILPSFTN